MSDILEQVAGGLLVLFILADVFLTVLYARIGTGIISDHIAKWTWAGFRVLSKPAGRRRGVILSFCGPTILIVMLTVWVMGLTCGTAMIIHSQLGRSVLMDNGRTPTDFATALYLAGAAISTMGASGFAPVTSAMRLFFFANSIVGISVITLALSYLLQIYSALRDRNTLGVKLHVLSRQTGDAAEILAGVGPEGEFHTGYTLLTEAAAEMIAINEAHHFYPVLFYFRFRQPFYSVSHNARLVLDLVALIWTAIDQSHYRWLTKSAAIVQLNDAALLVMKVLEQAFVPGGKPAAHEAVDRAKVKEAWDRHFFASLNRLRAAGIEVTSDAERGAARYFEVRAQWETYVHKLGRAGEFETYETDPSTAPRSKQDEITGQAAQAGL